MITRDRLLELLIYHPDTGSFTWRVDRRRIRAGTIAGTPHEDGYVQIRVEGRSYRAHHLVWLAETGVLPPRLDHRDGTRNRNVFSNLRECTHQQNSQNQAPRVGCSSALKGAQWDKRRKCWVSTIRVEGRSRSLGVFQSERAAADAYDAAAREHFGEFARTNS